MFKEAISAVTSSVVGAAKRTIDEYRPSKSVAEDGAFTRIAQQGIVNMSYRSPVMADLANTMLQSFQIEVAKKEKIKSHIKSSGSEELRKTITKEMGSSASSKSVDAKMEMILEKMSATLDKSGAEEAKKTDIFAKYGKYFEDFKKTSTTKQDTQNNNYSTEPSGGGLDAEDSATLTKIEVNTLRTYNALEAYMSRTNLSGASGASPSGKSGDSFIDPLTGMPSITAAVGHIGGSFLGKIFDDATIEKFAAKTKKLLNLDDAEEVESVIKEDDKKAKPKKAGADSQKLKDVLGDLDLDLNSQTESKKDTESDKKSVVDNIISPANKSEELVSVSKEILQEIKKSNGSPKVSKQKPLRVPTKKEMNDKISSKNSESLSKKSSGVSETIHKAKESANYIPKRIPTPTTIPKVPMGAGAGAGSGLGGAATTGAASAAGGAVAGATTGAVAGAVGGIGSLLLGGLGVIGAGVAGVAAGAGIVSPLIDKGLSSATGKETSLGSYIYDKMNPEDPMLTAPTTIPQKVTPAPSMTTSSVSKLTAEKTKKEESASAGNQPIVISTTNTSSPNQGQSSTTPTPTLSIRNQESTFERVQMQDFWPRTA